MAVTDVCPRTCARGRAPEDVRPRTWQSRTRVQGRVSEDVTVMDVCPTWQSQTSTRLYLASTAGSAFPYHESAPWPAHASCVVAHIRTAGLMSHQPQHRLACKFKCVQAVNRSQALQRRRGRGLGPPGSPTAAHTPLRRRHSPQLQAPPQPHLRWVSYNSMGWSHGVRCCAWSARRAS